MLKSSLLLAALLAVALAACGKNDEPAPASAPAPVSAPAPASVVQPATPSEEALVERAEEAAETAEAAADEAVTAAGEATEAVEQAAASAAESAAEAVGETDIAPLSAVAAENLAKAKNCMACHAIDSKLVGPSYKEVSEKRAGEAGAVAMLAEKIQKGGSGVYGPVPMPPNPQVTAEEAAQLAQWVLSLQ